MHHKGSEKAVGKQRKGAPTGNTNGSLNHVLLRSQRASSSNERDMQSNKHAAAHTVATWVVQAHCYGSRYSTRT